MTTTTSNAEITTQPEQEKSRAFIQPLIPLAYKIALLITILLSVSLGALWFIISATISDELEKQAAIYGYSLANQAADSAAEMILAEDQVGLQVLVNRMTEDANVSEVAIHAQDGTLLASSPAVISITEDNTSEENQNSAQPPKETDTDKNLTSSTESPLNLQEKPSDTPTNGTKMADAASQTNPLKQTHSEQVPFVTQIRLKNVLVGWVKIVIDRSHLELALNEIEEKIGFATLLMLAISVTLAFLMGRRMSQPVDDLVLAASKVANDYNHKITANRNDEFGNIIHTLNQLADDVSDNSLKAKSLSRLAPPAVINKLQAAPEKTPPSELVVATVMFIDMVGFTSLSEKMAPQAVANLLNRYFAMINKVAKLYNGVVDKYLGDGAMITFGAPHQDEEHCFHALCAAYLFNELIKLHHENMPESTQLPEATFRVGIHTGEMIAGAMGCDERMQFTVIGDSVNLASRLCTIGEPNQTIISEKVLQHGDIKSRIVAKPYREVLLKGKSEPTKSYRVEAMNEPYRQLLERQVEHLNQQTQ
ncbi:MAG: adenylate/guanylate cyclase domain-containing protein [Pseudomonadota bacterium]